MLLFLVLIWAHLCILVIKKDVLVFGEDPTQGLDNTKITAEAKYLVDFTDSGKRFVLSLYYNRSNILIF